MLSYPQGARSGGNVCALEILDRSRGVSRAPAYGSLPNRPPSADDLVAAAGTSDRLVPLSDWVISVVMTRTTCHMSISLDGFVAGPSQGRDDPVGVGGLKLHEWHWHAGEPGHEADAGQRDELLKPRGAYVMGRNMFGPVRDEWDGDWRGWWGDGPPYHAPVFVLTHYPREPVEMRGGTTFHFVTAGFDAALDRARAAVGGGDVAIAGGA